MQTITTNTYKIQVDDRLTVAAKELEYFTLSDKTTKHQIQMPMLNMALSELKDFDEYPEFKGETYQDTLINYFKSKRYQIELEGDLQTIDVVVGHKAYYQKCFSEVVHGKELVKIHHYFINIPLDDEFMLEISADCEDAVRKTYEPLFWYAINSLEFLGNFRHYIDISNGVLDERLARIDARLEKAKAENPNLFSVEEDTEEEKEAARLYTEQQNKLKNWTFDTPEKESIVIGNFDFKFMEEDCSWYINDFRKKLAINIKAKTTQIQEGKKSGLLEDYAYNLEDGEIKLDLDCNDIYNNGMPATELLFEDGKTGAPQFIRFQNNGIDLDFNGKVIIKNGWVGINGIFKKSYRDEPSFPITVYKQFDVKSLDWKNYQFSLNELQQYPNPKDVQYIQIFDDNLNPFPAKILDCKNLKTLSISGSKATKQKADLKHLPEDFGHFTQLKELFISNTLMEELPESLGNLKQLEQLSLGNNELTALPKGVFQLPKLNYLWVSRNNITALPETMDLPNLKSIDLTDNQLKTLPENLAKQPQINSIKVDRNPLEHLPDVFNEINLELNIDDKRKLLDYSYKGADGKGTIEWNNEVFFAQNDSDLKQRILDATKEGILNKYQDAFLKIGFKSVGMNITDADDYSTVGNTRFGGLPDLPKGTDYPGWDYEYEGEKGYYHYQFIAQLNCEELAPFQDYLPRTGMLYFFINHQEDFKPKIIYAPANTTLISASEINENDLDVCDDAGIFEPFKIEPSNFVGIPHFYNDELWSKVYNLPELEAFDEWDNPEKEAFDEVSEEFHKQLGKKGKELWEGNYHTNWQHSINDYVFTQHEQPQEQAALAFKGNPEDYIVLLKVNSDVDHSCGFCFWDAGELFFVIHKSDLAKGDFSKIYCSIETS